MTPTDDLALRRDGDIAILTINRPAKRNAMTLAMWQRLPSLLAELGDARVLIVTGAGDHFCAGADIGEFGETRSTPAAADNYRQVVDAAESALSAVEIPVIAAIRGVCIGGGMEIALGCDLRYAAPDSRFGITAAKLGVVYGVGASRRLTSAVGAMWAKYVLLSGEIFDVPLAERMGLLTEVADDPYDAALQLARLMASRSPYTQRASKLAIDQYGQVETLEGPDLTELTEQAVTSDYYREQVARFNKRD
ncbi:enoyl-CoA hydratase [Epidermidibacterium keratini]|uniref:Enoyl-CoA hydratase n=1 Tax=Epidermidibacterium keratini TaxID=1891644 RepID=A0A7L4YLN4_9ACTN|nr:enoyl-CoA hydratase-related protein [Epidermidibacterium keratini]QHC00181.1 enoyl-CoA hydratase [Epidermidibacterium keratini]